MDRSLVTLLLTALFPALAAGCASSPRPPVELATDATALRVLDARADEEAIYIRYSGVVGQSEDIERRAVLNATAAPVREVDLAARLEFVGAADWDARSAAAIANHL